MEANAEQSATMSEVTSLQTLTKHGSDVNSVDFAANYVIVTGCADKNVRVWEWCSGEGYVQCRFSPLKGHKYGVTCVKVSPQSTMLASSSIDGTTFLWNLRTGVRLHRMVQTGGEAVRICRFSGNSLLLATAGDNGQVCVWDLIHRMLIRTFQQHESAIQTLCFSPDSSWLVTACTFGVIKVFSVAEICELDSYDSDISNAQLNAHDSVDDAHDLGVLSCDIARDYRTSKILPQCSLGWSLKRRIILDPDKSILNGDKATLSKFYRLATCGNDNNVKLWKIDVLDCKHDLEVHGTTTVKITLERTLEKHSSALTCVRFNASGSILASCGLDKTTVLWEAGTGKMLTTISGHRRYVSCCAFSRTDDLLASGSNDKTVIVWDLTGELTTSSELVKPTRFGTMLGVTESERDARHEKDLMENVEASCDNQVQFLQQLDEHSGPVNSVAFYENDLIASGSGDKQIRIWSSKPKLTPHVESEEPADEEEKKQSQDDEVGAKELTVPSETSKDGLFQEKSCSPLEGHKYSVNYVEFSPSCQMLASCSLDGTTIIWDLTVGEVRAKSTFVNSGYGIRVCRWSPDGRRIATAGEDETARLWSVSNMEELCVFEGHSDAVNTIAFTPDSRYLVTACAEGSWRLFDITTFRDMQDQDFVGRIGSERAILVCEEAHDLGVQGCDFSCTSDMKISDNNWPYDRKLIQRCINYVPGIYDPLMPTERRGQRPKEDASQKKYFLVSGGNDSLVKLWQITCTTRTNDGTTSGISQYHSPEITVSYVRKKVFAGHGGNVINVRFSPSHGEVFASVATDKTARIWSVFTGASLHVLEHHDSLVTTCAFSKNASLFLTGSLDRSIVVWKLPERLVSQTVLIESLVHVRKRVSDWKTDEIVQWLTEIGLSTLSESARKANMNGQQLLATPLQELALKFGLSNTDQRTTEFQQQHHWLKSEDSSSIDKLDESKIPHKFLCPITHEIMKEPVQCSDGFTYERAAITEWFLCGKYTSPMTNECLSNTTLASNFALRNEIYSYLYGSLDDSGDIFNR